MKWNKKNCWQQRFSDTDWLQNITEIRSGMVSDVMDVQSHSNKFRITLIALVWPVLRLGLDVCLYRGPFIAQQLQSPITYHHSLVELDGVCSFP